jgi:4'-phosphopantetheinyl transferase EntD
MSNELIEEAAPRFKARRSLEHLARLSDTPGIGGPPEEPIWPSHWPEPKGG